MEIDFVMISNLQNNSLEIDICRGLVNGRPVFEKLIPHFVVAARPRPLVGPNDFNPWALRRQKLNVPVWLTTGMAQNGRLANRYGMFRVCAV